MAVPVIGLIGFIGSGKDTVASRMIQQGATRDSFASPLKDLTASVFGWPRELLEGDTVESRDFRETADMFWGRKLGIPNFTPRLALQLIGTDVMRNHFHTDIWLSSLEYRLRLRKKHSTTVVISDARFRNELSLIKQMGGKVIWVQRGELPEWYSTAVKANEGNVIAKKVMETKYCDIHSSEWDWAGFDVDYIVKNDGTLDELYDQLGVIQAQISVPKLQAI
jgi:hypothetical protein